MEILEKDYSNEEKLLKRISESFNESVIKLLVKFELYDLYYKSKSKIFFINKIKKIIRNIWNRQNFKKLRKIKNDKWLSYRIRKIFFGIKSNEKRTWLERFIKNAKKSRMVNISFGSYFQSNNYKGCLNILLDSKGLPESAVFAKTYIPSKVEEVIEL